MKTLLLAGVLGLIGCTKTQQQLDEHNRQINYLKEDMTEQQGTSNCLIEALDNYEQVLTDINTVNRLSTAKVELSIYYLKLSKRCLMAVGKENSFNRKELKELAQRLELEDLRKDKQCD